LWVAACGTGEGPRAEVAPVAVPAPEAAPPDVGAAGLAPGAPAQVPPAAGLPEPVTSEPVRAPLEPSPSIAPATPPMLPEVEPAAAPAVAPNVVPEAPPAALDYTLAAGHNALYVVVKFERGTVGAALAHDHVVVATQYSGQVRWDPADPSGCRIAVDVPTSGLRVDPPGAREKAGLEGPASVDDHPTIEANFNGKKQLDSAAFPTLTFRSTGCAARPDGKFDVTGALTVHGVSRPTTVAMAIDTDGDTLTAKGRFTAAHSDFGMTPFSAAMGAVRNAEPLTFVIGIAGRASP
ncbi:MAG: YceI family protein, partial [Myxococcota bacterium]